MNLIETFPELESHFAAIADVVAFPRFDNAIDKVQRGNELFLNVHGKRAVSQFLKSAQDKTINSNEGEKKKNKRLS